MYLGDEIPQIKVGNKFYAIGDMVGKTIVANENTRVFRLPVEVEQMAGQLDAATAKKQAAPVWANTAGVVVYRMRTDPEPYYATPGEIYRTVAKGGYIGAFNGYAKNGYWSLITASGNKVVVNGKDAGIDAKYYSDVQNYLRTVKTGQNIGVLYSWVNGYDKDGNKTTDIWLSFNEGDGSGRKYYCKLTRSTVNQQSIESQGVVDTETKIEEQQEGDKPWYEIVGGGLQKGLLIGFGAWVLVKITTAYIEKQPTKTNSNV